MGEKQEYEMIYESKVENATVIVKNKPNINLIAKAIIRLQENLEIEKLKERGVV
jgi:hypothetical protein